MGQKAQESLFPLASQYPMNQCSDVVDVNHAIAILDVAVRCGACSRTLQDAIDERRHVIDINLIVAINITTLQLGSTLVNEISLGQELHQVVVVIAPRHVVVETPLDMIQ